MAGLRGFFAELHQLVSANLFELLVVGGGGQKSKGWRGGDPHVIAILWVSREAKRVKADGNGLAAEVAEGVVENLIDADEGAVLDGFVADQAAGTAGAGDLLTDPESKNFFPILLDGVALWGECLGQGFGDPARDGELPLSSWGKSSARRVVERIRIALRVIMSRSIAGMKLVVSLIVLVDRVIDGPITEGQRQLGLPLAILSTSLARRNKLVRCAREGALAIASATRPETMHGQTSLSVAPRERRHRQIASATRPAGGVQEVRRGLIYWNHPNPARTNEFVRGTRREEAQANSQCHPACGGVQEVRRGLICWNHPNHARTNEFVRGTRRQEALVIASATRLPRL